MKRMLKMMSCLCVLLLLLPLHAVGEELTQLYLARSVQKDYVAYMAALCDVEPVEEPVMLYTQEFGASLAEGEQLTFTVTVAQDVFG